MNYDPNLTMSGRLAKQTVVLTLQQWENTGEFTVVVGGNCRGFDVLDSAVAVLYDRLYKEAGDDLPRVVLRNGENELICEDEEDDGEDWLKSMVTGVRITDIRPAGRIGAPVTDREDQS